MRSNNPGALLKRSIVPRWTSITNRAGCSRADDSTIFSEATGQIAKCSRWESNPRLRLRRPTLYPLSYGNLFANYTTSLRPGQAHAGGEGARSGLSTRICPVRMKTTLSFKDRAIKSQRFSKRPSRSERVIAGTGADSEGRVDVRIFDHHVHALGIMRQDMTVQHPQTRIIGQECYIVGFTGKHG